MGNVLGETVRVAFRRDVVRRVAQDGISSRSKLHHVMKHFVLQDLELVI